MVQKLFVLLFSFSLGAFSARAAEIKVLTAGATKAVLEKMATAFAEASGHTLVFTSDTAGGVAKRIEAGQVFDIAVATRGVMSELESKAKVAAGTPVDIARTSIGIAVRSGASLPDVSTLEAFKATLLAARKIAYVDPASGGTSGIYIAKVIADLGLTDTLKEKTVLKPGGYVAELAATGEVDIVIHQISEIVPVKGVVLVGPLPAAIQSVTTYTAALASKDASGPSHAFLAYVTGSEAAAVLKAAGMEKP